MRKTDHRPYGNNYWEWSLPLAMTHAEDESLEIISKALAKSNNPIVAYSGGKDSETVLHRVRTIDPSVPALFCNTGVEHPFTVKHCHTIPNLIEVHPQKSYWQCVDQYGWPGVKNSDHGTHGNQCCKYLKERPALDYYKANNVDLIFDGLTADESRQRWMFFKRFGHTHFTKCWNAVKCHPIHDWTEDMVWKYLRTHNVPYNPIYDKGHKRCGCMPCTAYISWKRNLAKTNMPMLRRILRMKDNQRQLTDYCTGGA